MGTALAGMLFPSGLVANDLGACVRLQRSNWRGWCCGDDGDDSSCGDYGVVGLKGLEPLRPLERQNLNLARLPIPPQPHSTDSTIHLACDTTRREVPQGTTIIH